VLDSLNTIDVELFRFINGSLSNKIFDFLMPLLTDLNRQRVVLVMAAVLILWMLIRGGRNVRLAAILLIVVITVSDQFSSSVVKYWFERPRPCHVLQNIRLLVGCGSGYSFPSSHAVNNFAGALVLSFFIPRYKWWFFGYASVIAFSRIYVGVHYPSDAVGGAVIGLICSGCVICIFLILENLWYRISYRKEYKK
jgi:undecaprenyl-diphosphatase